jgi:hypothetical protein
MPTTSYPWKQQLLRQAEILHEITLPHRWSEASSVKLEETVVLGFYGIRRLINAFLLSEDLVHRPIPMTAYPARRKNDALMGETSWEVLYDLKAGAPVTHDLLFLCHQVLHNCVFSSYFDTQRSLQGIYMTSDHQRKVALYGIDLKAIEALFHHVGAE